MKKFVLFVVVGLLVTLILAGCNANQVSSQKDNETKQTEKIASSGDLGNCIVEIKDYTIGKDQLSDAKVITVTFGFTNNFPDNRSFNDATVAYAFQNGIELDHANAEGEDYSSDTLLQPGISNSATLSWILPNTTDPVDIEVLENFSDGKTKVTKTFNLQ